MPPTTPMNDYYVVFEVSATALHEDIKASFHRLVRLHHPDKNNGSREATVKTQLVSATAHCTERPRPNKHRLNRSTKPGKPSEIPQSAQHITTNTTPPLLSYALAKPIPLHPLRSRHHLSTPPEDITGMSQTTIAMTSSQRDSTSECPRTRALFGSTKI